MHQRDSTQFVDWGAITGGEELWKPQGSRVGAWQKMATCKEGGEGKVVTRFPEGVREKAAEEFEGALAMREATPSFPSIIGSITWGESPRVFMNSVLLI